MARKREKTETDGTGVGIAAAVELAGIGAVVVACDGLMEAEVARGEELFSDVAAGRSVEDEFCATPAEARLVSGCLLRDAAGAGGGDEESGAEAVCTRRTTSGKPVFCSAR